MAIPKNVRKDFIKYLGVIPDKRRRDYKDLIQKYGGEAQTIEALKARLNEVPAYNKQVKVRNTAKNFRENKIKQNKSATKIKVAYLRNKLFRTQPVQVWTSYFKYKLVNTSPDFIPMPNTTEEEFNVYGMMGMFDKIKYLDTHDFIEFFRFYKVASFIENRLVKFGAFKLCISWTAGMVYKEANIYNYANWRKTHKSKTILTKNDIFRYLEAVYVDFTKKLDEGYTRCINLQHVNIIVEKVKPLSGSSYIPLPDWVANKKAVINIQNEDNLCFLYCVLCGIHNIYEEHNNTRVSKYKKLIDERTLKYEDKDMPMKIDKIIHFENRNNLQINVFGIENKSIVPLYVSSNRNQQNVKLIQLLYITEGEKSHYTYIKNFNKLMCEVGDKNSNYVCPYCCEYRTTTEKGIEKHKQYCISGQKVEVPSKNTCIKFEHFNYINECPIRIYCDFESFGDRSFSHSSKNGKTEFKHKHIGASFKILVVSDIPLSIPYEEVDKYYTHSIIYKGIDANDEYIRKIQELEGILVNDMKTAQELNKDFRTMKISKKQLEEFKTSTHCWVCNSAFKGNKVKHHNHFTGKYHSPLCTNCNIQIKDTIKIPVFFHNLNYDKNIFFKSLIHYKNIKEVSILPDNEESYKAFSVGKLHFLDSAKFMNSSLESLIKNLPKDKIVFLKQLAKTDEEFAYMQNKGFFPYEWFDCIEKLSLPIVDLTRHAFDNKLKLEKLSDEDWEYVQKLIKDLNITTFDEYHDFYLNIDVNGLADVFENFRNTSIETYKIDPCHYVGTPSFGWDAMLLLTKVNLDLLQDSDMYQFFERGIRGGQSVIFEKYCKANNKYLSDFDENEKSVYISYLDANNLYGEAMSHKLPIRNFQWCNDINEEMIRAYDEISDNGYVLEVDLHYPKELHDLHNDYPLAPVQYKPLSSVCHKLCGTFEDKKDYIVHIKNLKLYLEQGLKLTKISRAVKFEQTTWLKDWIDLNTDFRKKAKNDFEKDYFKLMNNAVFGKTMENVRDRIEVKCAFDESYYMKYKSKPNYHSCKDFNTEDESKTFMLMKLDKKTVCLDKPIYAGFTILDLSKHHMYDFHYNTMKPLYGDKIKLMMTDTDSLVYKIETDDFYDDMKRYKQYFDMSEYSTINPIFNETNKKVIGKFKDETGDCIPKEFIGVRSKVYCMTAELPSFYQELNSEEQKSLDKKLLTKKLKGIPKNIVKKEINVEHYSNCVLKNKDHIAEGIVAFRTKDLSNYTIQQNKVALRNKDDKRIWDGLNSYAYGHWRLK